MILILFNFIKKIRDAKQFVEATQYYTEKDLNEVQGEHWVHYFNFIEFGKLKKYFLSFKSNIGILPLNINGFLGSCLKNLCTGRMIKVYRLTLI